MRKMLFVYIAAALSVVVWTGPGNAEQKPGAYILNISVSGTGRVVGKDINCSAVCTVFVPAGTEVVLTAFPAREWHFVGWGGACEENGDCRVRMDADKSVEALFTYP